MSSLLVVSSLLVAATFASGIAGSDSITGEVIAAVQVFFFEGPGRKFSRLQQSSFPLPFSLHALDGAL